MTSINLEENNSSADHSGNPNPNRLPASTEGSTKKGGTHKRPKTSRPLAPVGQGGIEHSGSLDQKIRLKWGEGLFNLKQESPLCRAIYMVAKEQQAQLDRSRPVDAKMELRALRRLEQAVERDDAVLCYVKDCWAYFTTQPLSQQWGDDWNDAPYEHNAGEPYEYTQQAEGKPWSVYRVAFDGEFEPPCDRHATGAVSVQEFNWGGLHQNSLEKTIVDNYVKKITDYEALCRCVENELLVSMRGYVVCSWYNHWTSIIIEDIFKDHANVLPAVGLVKKIDFFVRDVPFDLKVTYLPEGYLKEKRQAADLRPELTLLKRASRTHGLPISADLADAALLQDLWAKVADHPSAECGQLIAELVNFRNALVTDIERDPDGLIRWLYENQGDRRFDASNRLFLVLVDQRNYFGSWKLKRAKPLMEEKIRGYLDGCGNNPGRRIEFDWEGERYSTVSDVLVVRHSSP